MWPERPRWEEAKGATLRITHVLAGASADKMRALFQRPEATGLPLDLAVLLDLGTARSSATAVMRSIIDTVGSVPKGSRVRVFSYPYRWDRAPDGADAGHFRQQVRFLESMNDQAHLSSAAAWEKVNAGATQGLASSADLGAALSAILDRWGPLPGAARSVRSLLYVSTSSVTVGDVSRVLSASQRAGNIPVFPIFLRTVKSQVSSTSGETGRMPSRLRTQRNEPGAYSIGSFHHRVAYGSGGWVLGDDLISAGKDRIRSEERLADAARARRSAQAARARRVERATSRLAAANQRFAKLSSEAQAQRRERHDGSISTLSVALAKATAVPVPPAPSRTPTGLEQSLSALWRQLAAPLILRAPLECAHVAATAGRPVRLILEAEWAGERTLMQAVGGCSGETLGAAFCVHPAVLPANRSPRVDEVRVWHGADEVWTSTDGAVEIPSGTLDSDSQGVTVEVLGSGFCGDAQLAVRVMQYDGVTTPPLTFWEAPPQLGAEATSTSRQRFFRLPHLEAETRRLLGIMTLHNGLGQTARGASVAVPPIAFDGAGGSASWWISLLLLAAAAVVGTRGFRRLRELDEGASTGGTKPT